MTEKKLYTCDICHTDYADKENAKECEKSHVTIKDIHNARYNAHVKYPFKIEVSFADGTVHWYRT